MDILINFNSHQLPLVIQNYIKPKTSTQPINQWTHRFSTYACESVSVVWTFSTKSSCQSLRRPAWTGARSSLAKLTSIRRISSTTKTTKLKKQMMSITRHFKIPNKGSWISFTVFMRKIWAKIRVNHRRGRKLTEQFWSESKS